MAKRAKRSFTLYGDGRTYTIHPTTLYADTHPVVTANPERFSDVTEETGLKLGTPTVLAGEATDTTIAVSWEAVAHATRYEVTTSPATETHVVEGTELELTGLTPETSYTISVKATNGNPNHTDSDAGTDTAETTA